jgi:hypothetical protein
MSATKDTEENPVPAHEESAVKYELSEEEQPAINFQAIMACIVRILGLKLSIVPALILTDPDQALSSQFNAYILSLLISGNALSYINADPGPQNNYPWITVSWNLGPAVLVSVGGRLPGE